jgi:hypothetical protein
MCGCSSLSKELRMAKLNIAPLPEGQFGVIFVLDESGSDIILIVYRDGETGNLNTLMLFHSTTHIEIGDAVRQEFQSMAVNAQNEVSIDAVRPVLMHDKDLASWQWADQIGRSGKENRDLRHAIVAAVRKAGIPIDGAIQSKLGDELRDFDARR